MQNQNRQPNRNTPQRAQSAAANRSQNMCQRINSEFSDMNINPNTNIPVRLQPNPSHQMASTPTYRRTPERQQRYSSSDVAINRSQNRIGRSPSQHSFNGWEGNGGQRIACSTFTDGVQQGSPVRRGFGPVPNISPIRSTPAGSNYNPRINLNDIYNNSKNEGYHNTRRCCTEHNKMYSPSGSAQPTDDGGRTPSSSRQQQSERPCCSHEWNPVHPSHHTPSHMRRPQLSVKESSAGRAFVSGDLSKGPGPSTSAGKSEKDGAKDKNEAAERKPFADLQPACGVVINITEQMRPKCKTGGAPCIRRWTKANLRGPDGKIVDSIEREERYNCSETEDAPQRPESTGAKPKQNPAGAECREGNAGNAPFPIYEDLCCPQNAQRCQQGQPIQQAQQCPANPGNAPFPIYQDPSTPRNVQRYQQIQQTPPQRNICQALGIEAFNLPQGQGRFFTPTHIQQQAQLPWYDNSQQSRMAPAQNACGSRGGRNASGGSEPCNTTNPPRDQGQGQSPCDELAQQYRAPPRDSSRSQCDPAQRVEPVQAAQAAQSCLPCGLLISPTREPIRPSQNTRTENGCPDPNESHDESRDNTSYFGLPGPAASPSPSVCIKNLQSQQFQCLVKDLCSPGVIQETLDGKRNFNVTAFALAFGNCQNAPCNKPLVEPISLLEAFYLRINWEREQVKCLISQTKKEKDKAKKVDSKDLDKYFAAKPDTELNGAISSFLKAELEVETEKKLEPVFNAEIFKKQSTLAGSEFNNFQTQTLLTYTAKTTPKEASA